MVPFSEARVFRTDKGFIVKDKEDHEWCKYVPFDDLDLLKTKIAYKTLKPHQIAAMESMPIPSMEELPKDVLEDLETSFEKLCMSIGAQSDKQSFSGLNGSFSGPTQVSNQQATDNKPLRISSIRSVSGSSDSHSTMTLTKDDVVLNHFGTLAPFVDDYIQDFYELEEEHSVHLPSIVKAGIPTSNRYGPLSYQNSVLEEDPVLEEDLETSTTTSDCIKRIEETKNLTSPLLKTYLSQQQPASKQTAKHILDKTNDIPLTPSETDLWTIFQESLPSGFIIRSLLSLFLILIMTVGFIIHVNMAFLFFVFFILIQVGTLILHDISRLIHNFLDNYTSSKDKRQPFTNKKGITKKEVSNMSKLELRTVPITPEDETKQIRTTTTFPMNPLGHLSLTKPEGSVASSKKIKRVYHIKPARPSEARIIKTTDDLHYFKTIFFDHFSKLALYDPGACCCTISKKFLKELQSFGYVPLQENSVKLFGAVGNAAEKVDQVAYLDFQLETGHTIKNVPFYVLDSGSDVLIGSNLIRAHRWANCWKNSNFYIDIGNNEPLIPTYSDVIIPPDAPINAVAINKITIYPSETTTIGLKIPCMGSKTLNHFKKRDLITEQLDDYDNPDIDIHPTLTRLRDKELKVTISNKSPIPFKIHEGMELAKVSTLNRDARPLQLVELQDAKKIYNSIPRIHSHECHCQIQKRQKEDEITIKMLISDRLGYTSVGLVTDKNKIETLEPGIKFIPYSSVTDSPLLLIVTDKEGSLAHIDKRIIKRAFNQVKEYLDRVRKKPLFFFLDPLQTVAFTSRLAFIDIFKQFKFSFYPVRILDDHPECVRPSLSMNTPDLFTGISKTKIHLQNGPIYPHSDSMLREHGTPLKTILFYGSVLFMFRLGSTLNCHLHIPAVGINNQYLTESYRNRLVTSLFVELRHLKIPHEVQITTDGYDSVTGSKLTSDYLSKQVLDIVRNLPPFFPSAILTQWPSRNSEEIPIKVDLISNDCLCALCLTPDYQGAPCEIEIYKGNINDLIHSVPYPVNGSTHTSSSVSSRITPATRAIIASIIEVSDDFDTDQPLDYMQLCDEGELQTFLNTYPGTEADDEDVSNLPPPQPSNPQLFKDYDMSGIPDQFRPGDWRNTDIMDRLQGVTQLIKDLFGELLDNHTMTISYFDSNCRPVLHKGKPAVVDISLTTDEPLFMKPYMVNGVAVDMLDNKIDELLERNEIHPIESKYNVAIILTHHNSSQKHVDGAAKKVRMVLDLRGTNAIMKDKNLHSYLVKKIEDLFMTIYGSTVMTSFDISKAYRALVASPKLQQICAFRTPSSRKYPHVTWAFRSACDGLANLPGYYSFLIAEALSKEAKQFTIAHIDDILIYSKSDEEHLKHLDIVLTDLGKCNFMISAKKMQPFQRSINFLGHMLDGQHKWIPEDRKSYFDKLEPPTSKKQLQSLLGVANYMANFIDSYAMIAGPLYDAMRGKTDKTPIVLNEIQMKSFLELKEQIAKAPKLCLLDTSKTIFMECDASLVGTGSVIYHEREVNGKLVRDIIRYGSRRFSLTESLNHTSLEREAMAILIGVKQHMAFLQACPHTVIKTDLKSLITLLSCYNNPSSARFAILSHQLYALNFEWSLIHSPGTEYPLADMLSRMHKPYTSFYTDRHLRYPDLKRDNIMMPPEWRNKPDLRLTTADLLEAMRQQIVFIEKSSNSVKEKRLKALINEVALQYEDLAETKTQLASLLENDITRVRDNIATEKQDKSRKKAQLNAITAVPPDLLITPQFIIKHQNKNPRLANIITMLRTLPVERIPKTIFKKYRILNDTILVTRKHKELDFDHIGNLRIVCDEYMTLHILALIHVMSGHYGMNTLYLAFNNTYKCIEKSTQGFVKLICNACRSCRYHRQISKRVVPLGRIPIPNVPNDTWMVDFMEYKREQTYKGRAIAASFNIVDLYSNIFISIPVKNQTTATVIDCFKYVFSLFNVPRKIVSDNASSLCRNPEVLQFLRASNVKQITTTTAYNSQANKVERMHKTFRDTLKLVQETFKRKSPFDMYYYVVRLMNLRPLSLSLHPYIKNICAKLKQDPGVITPFSLHFGLPPSPHAEIPLENKLDPVAREKFIKKWQHIIKEYDRLLQQDLDKLNENQPKRQQPESINIGDLVILKNNIAHKESLRFYKNIYEVVDISGAKYKIVSLFPKGRPTVTNGNNLKPYRYFEVLNQLPQKIRELMGENLSPEELKKQSIENPNFLPEELHTWTTPTTMSLRNRLTPKKKTSEPALSIINTDILSSTDSDSSIFTIPDQVSDFKSEASSLINRSGAPQLKSTPHGLTIRKYNVPPNDHNTNKTVAENSWQETLSRQKEILTSTPFKHKLSITPNLAPNNDPFSHILEQNITVRKKNATTLNVNAKPFVPAVAKPSGVRTADKSISITSSLPSKIITSTPLKIKPSNINIMPTSVEDVIQQTPPVSPIATVEPPEQDLILPSQTNTQIIKNNDNLTTKDQDDAVLSTPILQQTEQLSPTKTQTTSPNIPVKTQQKNSVFPKKKKYSKKEELAIPKDSIKYRLRSAKSPKRVKLTEQTTNTDPNDSIKYRLRSSLKPFKFLSK